jgi:hypothetical protein
LPLYLKYIKKIVKYIKHKQEQDHKIIRFYAIHLKDL